MKNQPMVIPAKLVLAKRLGLLLKEKNITQETFASEVNISVSALKKYLAGNESSPAPSIETLRAMAARLSVSTDYLIGATNFAPTANQLTVGDLLEHLIVVLDHTDLELDPNTQANRVTLVSNNPVLAQFLKDYYQSQRKWLTPEERSAARNQLLEGSIYKDCLIYQKSLVTYFDFFFEKLTNSFGLTGKSAMAILNQSFEILRAFQKENKLYPGGPAGLKMDIPPAQMKTFRKMYPKAKTDAEAMLAACGSLDSRNVTAIERKTNYLLSLINNEESRADIFVAQHKVDVEVVRAVAAVLLKYAEEYSEETISDEFDYFPF